MKCPKCKTKLIEYPTEKGNLIFHPLSEKSKNCPYKDDGVQINVIDPIINKKFKEIIEESSFWNKVRRFYENTIKTRKP